jgi:hypothetical protein
VKLIIEATDKLTELDGVRVRVWNGKTEDGKECLVFVHQIAVDRSQDASAFERAFKELPTPAGAMMVPLEHVEAEDIARRMFEAYNQQGPNPWKTWDGKDVPRWPELNDQVRGKWVAAARAVTAPGSTPPAIPLRHIV